MHEAILFILLPPVLSDHLGTFGFLLIALPLLGFVGFELRRAAKQKAEQKDSGMTFLAPFRDENGMPIFYEAGEDPSARYAQRVLHQTRRANAAQQRAR